MDTIPTIIVDSLSYGWQVDVLKEMLEQQANSYSLMLYVLIAILTALLGISWWRFATVSKNAIENMKDEVLSELANNQKVEWNKFKEDSKVERESQFEKLENQLLNQKAEFNRLTAVQLFSSIENEGDRANVLSWWQSALKYYIELEDGYFSRACLNGLIATLSGIKDFPKFIEQLNIRFDLTPEEKRDSILETIDDAPDSFSEEIKKIKTIVKKWK